MELYSPDQWTPTSAHLLATVADDTDLYLQKVATDTAETLPRPGLYPSFQMPSNCRNISDEVFAGIHVGDQ